MSVRSRDIANIKSDTPDHIVLNDIVHIWKQFERDARHGNNKLLTGYRENLDAHLHWRVWQICASEECVRCRVAFVWRLPRVHVIFCANWERDLLIRLQKQRCFCCCDIARITYIGWQRKGVRARCDTANKSASAGYSVEHASDTVQNNEPQWRIWRWETKSRSLGCRGSGSNVSPLILSRAALTAQKSATAALN